MTPISQLPTWEVEKILADRKAALARDIVTLETEIAKRRVPEPGSDATSDHLTQASHVALARKVLSGSPFKQQLIHVVEDALSQTFSSADVKRVGSKLESLL